MPEQLPNGQILLFGSPAQEIPVSQEPLPTAPAQTLPIFTDGILESCLNGAGRIVRDVMERQWRDRSAQATVQQISSSNLPSNAVTVVVLDDAATPLTPPPAAPADEVLQTLQRLISGLQQGGDISHLKDELAKYVLNQESRAELVTNLVMTHDYNRLNNYMHARASLENILLQAATGSRLTPTQALAFLKIVQEESEIILNRVRAGATNVKDIVGLLNKADFALQTREGELAKKFASTTPQGREIVRRMAHRLRKLYGAAEAGSGAQVSRIED